MPELPEVETIVRDLSGALPGRTIAGVEVIRPDLIEGDTDDFVRALTGRRIDAVARRAKNIVLALDDATRLTVNLGMTGRLLLAAPGAVLPSHLGARFVLEGNAGALVYDDVRRFGKLWHADLASWNEWEMRLGVEPLSADFTPAWLHEHAARSRSPIKTWLMDQRRVVGVGNIYASEALFRAGIDPTRPASSLDADDAARLVDAVRAVLQEAIDFRGTTLLDYRDARGERGEFSTRLRVYDRAGEPCRICAAPLVRIVQGGRSTFYCPRCQR